MTFQNIRPVERVGGGLMALKRDRMSMEPTVEEITQKSGPEKAFFGGFGSKTGSERPIWKGL